MSGIEDVKLLTCENCPDRSIEPNCHETCEGYKYRTERIEKAKKNKHDTYSTYDTVYVQKCVKKRGQL